MPFEYFDHSVKIIGFRSSDRAWQAGKICKAPCPGSLSSECFNLSAKHPEQNMKLYSKGILFGNIRTIPVCGSGNCEKETKQVRHDINSHAT